VQKKAVDEFIQETKNPLLFHRIDEEARIAIKLKA